MRVDLGAECPQLGLGRELADLLLAELPLVPLARDADGVDAAADLERRRQCGVGLANIEQRLAGRYGTAAALQLTSEPNLGTTVEIRLPATAVTPELTAAGTGR